jgi:ribulose-5-phosphate 4-epimerase/fuculose-1-phosphate aldolase
VTGTQTGHLPRLGPEHYARLTSWDIDANRLESDGPIAPSSESLTHLALYEVDPAIGAVIHVHCAALWEALRDRVPTTAPGVPYGTPAMARAVQSLYRAGPLARERILVMAGHPDGVITFGVDLDAAGSPLIERIGRLAPSSSSRDA